MNFWMFNSKNPSKLFRVLARCVDYLLLFLVAGTVSLFFPWFIETYYYFIFALAIPLIWIPIQSIAHFPYRNNPRKNSFWNQDS